MHGTRSQHSFLRLILAPTWVFYTLDSKSRLDCLSALQGSPGGGVKLMWGGEMEGIFRCAKVSKSDSARVMELLTSRKDPQLSISEFEGLLQIHAPDIYRKSRIVSALKEVMALYYYNRQDEFRPLNLLLSDDAPEYNKIAQNHGLCWIHDARYYNKLSPQIESNSQKLKTFMAQYWGFYQTLLDYKSLPPQKQVMQKPKIVKSFDSLFKPETKYGHLDLCIGRTAANKGQLLLVLDFPYLPLHNNAAELSARKVVRKRDISLHTWADWGTRLWDAFLSIIETARKLNISLYDYINDRITGRRMMPSLAEMIIANSS